MTTPVAPAPVARSASPHGSDGGSTESAAPFASALDGALAEGSAVAGDGTGAPDQDASGEQPAGPLPGEAPADPAAAPAVPPALWALALAGSAGVDAPTGGEGTFPRGLPVAVGRGHVPGIAPGQAVADARVPGTAAGLSGDAGAPATAVPPSVGPAASAAPIAPAAASTPGAAPAPGTVPANGAVPTGQVVVTGPAAASATTGATTGASTPGAVPGAPAVPSAASDPVVVAPVVAGAGTGSTTPAPDAGAGGPDATTAPGSAPAAAPTAVGSFPAGSFSGGSGGSGGGGEQGGGAAPQPAVGTETTAPVGAAPDRADAAAPVTGATAAAAPPTAAPVARAEGATGTAAALPVGSQVAQHVAVLRGGPDGAHTMTLVLRPDTLGPVEVQVTLSQGTVELQLRGAHEHGRAALLDALPDLRRDLEGAGLSVSRAEVDRETGGSWTHAQQGSGERGAFDGGGRQERDARPASWLRTPDTGEGRPARAADRSTSSGVDVRV